MESSDHVVPGQSNEDLKVLALQDLLQQQNENMVRAAAVICNKMKIIEQLQRIVANQEDIIHTLRQQVDFLETIN